MSSAVYYRFRSSKQSHRLVFDGTGISVFDIKRGILIDQKLDGTADSFVLKLTNPDTNENYEDDSEVVPRSTSVEVRRLPVARPGSHDAASRYVTGSLVANAKNAARREVFGAKSSGANGEDDAIEYYPVSGGSGPSTEEDMMNAMFAAQGAQWSKTQQEMATKTPVHYGNRAQLARQAAEPDKTLPPGYICHRCGQKGHWITQCPSQYDPNWETKKVRRTTGIPKAMLRTIEKPTEAEDGKTYLMNADGEYVVAVADDKSWQDFQAKQLQQQAKSRRQIPDFLQDPINHDLLKNPRKMPCCAKVYSEESIEMALIQSDFQCPNCGTKDVYIDQLEVASDVVEKIRKFKAETGVADDKTSEDGQEEEGDRESSATTASSSESPAPILEFENSDDDSDYSPEEFTPGKRKRRRSSAGSIGTPEDAQSNASPEIASVAPASAPVGMMPYMFNPFFMPTPMGGDAGKAKDDGGSEDSEDLSDFEYGDEQEVVGRIR